VLEKPQRELTLAPPSVLNEEEDEVNIAEGGEDGRRRIFLTKETGAQQAAIGATGDVGLGTWPFC
jgi:hypothetical protein